MQYAVFAFSWTLSSLQYTQLKQHNIAPPYSSEFKGPLSKWLTWAWPASVLSMPHQSMSLALCLLNTLVLSLFLSSFVSLPVLTLLKILSRTRNQQDFASTFTGREETVGHKICERSRHMRNCHDEKRKRESKKTKINGVDRAAMSYSMPGS